MKCPYTCHQYAYHIRVTCMSHVYVPHKLNADCSVHLSPGSPVVLVKSILNSDHRVVVNEAFVHIKQLVRRQLYINNS
jgi:hypothetical protein